MKPLARNVALTIATSITLAAGAAAVALQEMPEPARPQSEHQWLQQLVGEWSAVSEATMGPGTEPMKLESTETVRSIGGLWTVGEGSGSIDGAPMTWIMTLGYDPQQKAFVGTWIDSMQTHLWQYRGTLDGAKKALTLEAEGPAFDDPTKTAKYHDVITIQDADHRTLSSSVLGDDGKWTTFMTAKYTRKR